MATRAITRTRTVYMPRKRRGHRAKFNVPLAVVAGLAPTAMGLWGRRNSPQEMARFLGVAYSGYDFVGHRWTGEFLGQGIGSALLGLLVHRMADKFGINRAIRRAVPFISI